MEILFFLKLFKKCFKIFVFFFYEWLDFFLFFFEGEIVMIEFGEFFDSLMCILCLLSNVCNLD